MDNVIGILSISKESRGDDWSDKLEIARFIFVNTGISFKCLIFIRLRSKFQNILESSSNYRVQPILNRIKEFESVLQRECAILYEKVEKFHMSCLIV